MSTPLTLMCILAHPDDESLGMGGVLAKYASKGVETYLVIAMRGERGRVGDKRELLSLDTGSKISENWPSLFKTLLYGMYCRQVGGLSNGF